MWAAEHENKVSLPFLVGGNGGEFSPDGKQFFSIDDRTGGTIWDSSGQHFKSILSIKHASEIASAAYSPDSKILATGGYDGKVHLWNPENAEEITHFVPHEGATIGAIAFSPDGRYLATTGLDFAVKLWDTQTWEFVRQITGHSGLLTSVTFSSDSLRLLTGSADWTARVWDVETGAEIRRLVGHKNGVRRAIFSPDDQSIVSASIDGKVLIWQSDFDAVVAFACEQLPRDLTPLERETYLIEDQNPTCLVSK